VEIEGDLTALHRVSEAVDAAEGDKMRFRSTPKAPAARWVTMSTSIRSVDALMCQTGPPAWSFGRTDR